MDSNAFSEQPLNFPIDCCYKVIAENIEGIDFVIETVLLGLEITAPVLKGNLSANGRYITFNIVVRVESKEWMNRIDGELRNIQGVRMVL